VDEAAEDAEQAAPPSPDDAAAPERRPRVAPDVWAVELDGELVVYNPVDGAVHEMNRLGSLVWPFLDGAATVAELTDDLADVFDVGPEQVRAELAGFLDRLDLTGLLVDRTTPEAAPAQQVTAGPRRDRPGYLADPPAP
jgi:PqqD family protein of HPr-rel-A system